MSVTASGLPHIKTAIAGCHYFLLYFLPTLAVRRIRKHKVKIDFRKFIHVEGLTAKEVRAQRVDFSKFHNVILTSRNSVDHFFRITEEMRFKVPDRTKYFCQSEAVAFYLQKYVVYRKRKIYVGQKDFIDLTPLLKKYKEVELV